MRMLDYAKEISRLMGRQLVRGLKGEKDKEKGGEKEEGDGEKLGVGVVIGGK